LPNDAEWATLVEYVGNEVAGYRLKANTSWQGAGNGIDNFGFSALASGFGTDKGSFLDHGYTSLWKSATEMDYHDYTYARVWGTQYNWRNMPWNYGYKAYLYSVRCVRPPTCNGVEYDGITHVCESGELQPLPLCDGKIYDPATHFCTRSESNPQVVVKCGGKGYDTRTKECKDGEVQEIPPELPRCGEKTYDPAAQQVCEGNIVKTLFTDERDGGKIYKSVKIGDQVWMAENLNYNANGSKCYDNKEANCETYGRLYSWATAVNVCPDGWHLPSDAEWETLVGYVGYGNYNKWKANSDLWKPNTGTDEFGFAALPGGYYYSRFSDVGIIGYWWSASAYQTDYAYRRTIATMISSDTFNKNGLFSVRCLKGFL